MRAFDGMRVPKSPYPQARRGHCRVCPAASLQPLRRSNAPLLRRPNVRSIGRGPRCPDRSTALYPTAPRCQKSHHWQRPRYEGSSGNFALTAPPWRRENPFQSVKYCQPRHRASHRWIGHRPPHSKCFYAPRPKGAATNTGQRWCPDIRPPR